MEKRSITLVDRIVIGADRAVRTLLGTGHATGRANPAEDVAEVELTEPERRHSAALMRVNHSGEIAAQALYHGQAMVARRESVREILEHAAREENDHLAWCENRLRQLGSRTSFLGPGWYLGSLAIGTLAGLAGDKWSLGFLAETERQVVDHLDGHLSDLPQNDGRSRRIIERMREEEGQHATTALRAGAAQLPTPVRALMRTVSRVMTRTAYWI